MAMMQNLTSSTECIKPQPQQQSGRPKKIRLAMTRTPRPAPSPASPTTPPPVTVATSFKNQLRHIFTRPPQHAMPPVVDVPLRRCNAAGGPKDMDDDLIRDEDYNGPPMSDPNEQQQQKAAIVLTDTGEHGGGRSCWCC
ncbi:hypothetical protein CY34DRAFT_15599 [Suillus luteus UH-Slu-Lm8-n1]|uniref:Uncharacterized protein n=1 Tax=Suillus luteus UH-Slu-Lm8-n1 TaxID=930992 RepID=A0A0D0ATM4_9AGAM|nr:hypothetical protein CY34DRAFT_15599 [Suillus luteus UH-Slu-Lm8-n1]